MKTSINALHHLAGDWTKELTFYRDELSLLQKRIEEVASNNTSQEVLVTVEHLQNRFILLFEQADVLKHEVNRLNDIVTKLAESNPSHTHEKSQPEAQDLQNRITSFAKSVSDTRFELNTFLSKVL